MPTSKTNTSILLIEEKKKKNVYQIYKHGLKSSYDDISADDYFFDQWDPSMVTPLDRFILVVLYGMSILVGYLISNPVFICMIC